MTVAYDYDLLIAGGGLVGGSLALALQSSPLRIGVIEAMPSDVPPSPAADRALAIAWGSAQILDQIGIWKIAQNKATPISTIHVSDQGHFGKVRLDAQREGVPALGYVITAKMLEEAVQAALSASAVSRLQPARVIGVKSGADGVHVSLKLGEQSLGLTARLLVAADGGNSTVRKLLEIGQITRNYGQTALVVEVETERLNHGKAFERFTRFGPLAVLPTGKRTSSVVWTRADHEAQALMDLPDVEFCQSLQEAFGLWLGRLKLVSSRQNFPLKLIRSERMVDERVVLIGNAMHQLHPVAGQGLNLGLRDVALLAERLVAQLDFKGDIGERRLLDQYAAIRRTDLERTIQFTDGMVRVFSNDSGPLSLARNLGMLALDQSRYAKSMLAGHAMGIAKGVARFR